jgi:membrane fusion protein, multidrug efflux system
MTNHLDRRRGFPTASLLAATTLLLIAGCRSGASTSDDEGSAPPASAVVMAVTGATAIVAPMHNDIRLLGTTVALRHITLRSPAAGRIVGFNLQSGDRVVRGQMIAHIINREVDAAEQGLAVAQQIDPSEERALTGAVKRYVHGNGISVNAPENAVVAQRLVSNGQLVADLDPLADLIDPRSVYVEAAVPVDDLSAIRTGMAAVVSSPLHPRVEFPGRVVALSPSFSQSGATSPARVEFTGAQRINEAGAPIEVRVTASFVPDAIVVPAAAVFQDASNDAYYVFVAGADNRAHRTPVTLGIRTQNQVQVTSGIQPGAVVITSGGYALSDGLKVNVAVAQK